MADLVMKVRHASAHRSGSQIVVQASGEAMNSRDDVFAETSTSGAAADVYVRTRPAGGFGTEMTGPFSVTVAISNATGIKTVKVHAKNGTKTIEVQ